MNKSPAESGAFKFSKNGLKYNNVMIFFNLAIFVFGLAVGSFLNCVIYRLALPNFSLWKNLGGLRGRSFCPKCKHILRWYDLIPLLSFLLLRGKCRYCAQKISSQYPLVELATAILFVLIFWHLDFGLDLTFGFLISVACFLIIIFVYDLKHYLIPDKVLFSAIGIVFLYNLILNSKFLILNSLLSAFGAAFFFLIIFLVSWGKWLGFGDVKLAFFMGFFLGYPKILVALFLGFFIGAIIGLGLILLKKKGLKSEIPFGPFLITGTFIALFWGEPLINWYLNLFKFV